MENSAIADLTLSRDNPGAVLKFSIDNQITHEMRLTMDRNNISTDVVSPTDGEYEIYNYLYMISELLLLIYVGVLINLLNQSAELIKLSVTINKENSDSTLVSMPETRELLLIEALIYPASAL